MPAKLFIISAPPKYELISIKGMEALKECDVVLYDRLIDKKLLTLTNAKKIYVGKTPYSKHTNQQQINELIERYLKEGLKVARLKGGDVAFFSRVKEEVDIAKSLSAQVEWISGVTSASIMCEKLKMPLTSRNVSNGVIFITGHDKEYNIKNCYDWESIVKLNMTVVIYMGIKNLSTISKLLIKYGMDKETPVAIGMSLGFDDERFVFFKLDEVDRYSDTLSSPAIVVIGDIVNYSYLKEELYGK